MCYMICFRGLSPTVAVRGLKPTAGVLPPLTRFDWIIHDHFRGLKPTAGVLPPRRGSCGCYTFSVGCVHAFGVHSTHGWGTVIAMSVGYTHGWDTVIATRFMRMLHVFRGLHPRLRSVGYTHGCGPWVTPTAGILPPLRGSDIYFMSTVGCVHAFGVHSTHGWDTAIATRFMWVAPTAGIPPSLCDSIATRFFYMKTIAHLKGISIYCI